MVVLAPAGAEGLFGPVIGDREAAKAARRTLRDQVARLERDLAEIASCAFPRGGVTVADTRVAARARGPRLLDLGDLERLRDDLATQLQVARRRAATRSDEQQRARDRLEAMFLEPGKHKFARVTFAELGERSCGAWHVRPRLGLIGMLMGWWQIKLSSGCPLAAPHPAAAAARAGSLPAPWASAPASATCASRAIPSRPTSGRPPRRRAR